MSLITKISIEEIGFDNDLGTIDPVKLFKWCVKNDVEKILSIDPLYEIDTPTGTTTTTDIDEVIKAQGFGLKTREIGWQMDVN